MIAVLASNNAHKLKEIRALLADKFEHVCSLGEMGINTDIDETGTTFEENAFIKAQTIFDMLGGKYAVLADDSGLCVEALGGAPGVYSARYAGSPCNDENNNSLLLRNLHEREKTEPKNRRAFFASVVAAVLPDGRKISGEGRVYGEVLDEYRGNGGFGYDPLFYCTEIGKTFAEATMEEKNTVSHRSRALSALREKL